MDGFTHSESEIKLISALKLRGCNVYHSKSVIRQEVDLGVLAGAHSGWAGPEFTARFIDRFGGLRTPDPTGGLPDAILDRLNSPEGTPFAELLLRAILAVENSLAFVVRRLPPVEFAHVVAAPSPERAFLIWSCRDLEVSRRTAKIALIGLCEVLSNETRRQTDTGSEEFDAAYQDLQTYARQRSYYNMSIMVQAAEKRGIPWETVKGRVTRLGQGKYQQYVNHSETENTAFIAQKLARDKHLTNHILSELGIPVPKQAKPANVKDALKAAQVIGYPVVVKPLDSNTGRGVSANLKGPDEIPAAFERANQYRSKVIVESFIEGQDHRLLIVGGRMVAATKRIAPFVTGDGKRTIGELIEELNSDPRRDGFTLLKVTLDGELNRLLKRAGYRLDHVLGKDETFALRSMANYHAGGTTIDVTDRVHPDNQEMAIRAADAVRLDVAGIDVLTNDISQSYKEVGGAIIEVNSRPGFDLHTWTSEGTPRDVAGATIETIFSPGDQGRISNALVVEAQENDSVARILDHIAGSAGMTMGLVTQDGAFVGGELASPERASQRRAIRAVVRNPRVEAMVSTMSPRQVVREGLLHDICDAAAILCTASDEDATETGQELEVVIRATRGKLVVGAQNKQALENVRHIDPNRLVLVSRGAGNGVVRRHLDAGGQAVVTARDNGKQVMVMLDGNATVATIPIKAIQPVVGKQFGDHLETHLFAVALAWSMGVSAEEIISALRCDSNAADPVSAPVVDKRELIQIAEEVV